MKRIILAFVACAGCGSSSQHSGQLAGQVAAPPAAAVPDNLKPPAGQSLVLEAQAVGVQIYECKPSKDDPAKLEWTLKAPEADLLDAGGNKIGKHYGGPTWESTDGSKVVGELKAKDPGPDPTAIPWLLIAAKSTSGTGVLAQTAHVQRLKTVGGKAPADGCGPDAVGKEIRVPYRATYYFYAAK
jgi:uncharacterized protein DUF3455